ncbi:hypothetical protein BDN72DRAFT_863943 [Pluteus cervinus]|uniref:Uncharacterized protein n=1 Tax=Pluteus cervinus TaxID=181527 RepID=A0ACD3A6G2_9AGAR|nr:hypothetical protein BDN72DRAFT_863943 [Pluteus cervinus]
MPRTWTTVEQRAWLETKVSGFVDARTRGRSTAYAKGVHHAFAKIWPELDELFAQRINQRPINLTANEAEDLKVYKRKRAVQILNWLQRNSTQRGRRANRAVKVLLRNHAPRRQRTYQLGEVYNKLYPEKVNTVYQERKDESLSKGQRLNLIKKISEELLEDETEEVKEEVEREQAKRRNELDARLESINSGEAVDLDELTIQQYIDALPELLTSVLGEIGKYCPDWGFLLLASGPMPKANNSTHVFDIYTGPKSAEGYTFAEANEDFDVGLRVPFGNFVEAGIVDKIKREEAKAALNSLTHTINPSSDDGHGSPSPIASRGLSLASVDGEEDDKDEIEDPPTHKRRPSSPTPSDNEDEEASQPTASSRRPPRALPDSDESGDESDDDNSTPEHPLEVWPIEAPDSDGEPEVDVDELEDRRRKKLAGTTKEPVHKPGSELNKDITPQALAQAKLIEKRAEATKKRLETRKKNKAKKDEAEKVAKEAEAARKAKEVEAAKKTKAVEAAKKARVVEIAKNAKEAKEAEDQAAINLKVVEIAKKVKEAQEAEAQAAKKAAAVDTSKNASNSAAEPHSNVRKGKSKKGSKAADASKDIESGKGVGATKKGTKSTATNSIGGENDGGSHAQAEPTPAPKRRPPPAILPPPPTSKPVSPNTEEETPAPLKLKGKKSGGRKRSLEEVVVDEPQDLGPTKRPRRLAKAPNRPDAEVSFAKKTRSRRA